MATLNYRSLTIDRMWVLVEANSDVTDIVKQARRITDTSAGWLKRLVLRGAGDFPHFTIDMGDNFGGEGPSFTTFANEGATPTADWNERRTSEFKISIIYEKPGFDQQDALEMAVIEGLEAGGRNLGYTPIRVWGPWRARRNVNAFVGGTEVARPTTQITIPVEYAFTGSQL